MSTGEIETLKSWMLDKFDQQSRRLDLIEGRQVAAEARTDIMHAQIDQFDTVCKRLEALAESLEVMTRFFARGRRAWIKSAGFVGGFLLFVDLVARMLPHLNWPW